MKCPNCSGDEELLLDLVRQYPAHPGIADIGWKCSVCGWEFGFELSDDSPGDAQEENQADDL